jgi:hypothetical protein
MPNSQPPAKPAAPQPAQPPAASVEGAKRAAPPPDGPTIADEQRRRSEEIERTGVAKPPEASTAQVPGVVPPTKRS